MIPVGTRPRAAALAALAAALAGTSACHLPDLDEDADQEDEAARPWTDPGGGDSDSGLPTDEGGADTGEPRRDGETHPYTSYVGHETRWVAWGEPEAGDYPCILLWEAEGSPVSPMSSRCVGCAFAFEVELWFRVDDSIVESSCTIYAGNMVQTYAWAPDYYGAGEGALLYSYFESYYPRGEARFEDGVFTYGGGYLDYYYAGSYGYYPQYAESWFSNWRFGSAAVR